MDIIASTNKGRDSSLYAPHETGRSFSYDMLSLDAENWQLWRMLLTTKGGLQESVLAHGLPREMSMSDRHRNTMEHLNNVVSRNLRSSDRWTYRTLVVTLSSISQKWKITGLFVPFSGFFLIWNLGFLPRHSDGESPRVEPKSPSDHLEVSHGMCFYDVFDASTERCFKPLGRVQRQRHMMLDTVHISSRTDGCHKAPVMWRDLGFL